MMRITNYHLYLLYIVMSRKFDFLRAWTGEKLAKDLGTRVEALEQDGYVASKPIVHYSTNEVGERTEYSALIEYSTNFI